MRRFSKIFVVFALLFSFVAAGAADMHGFEEELIKISEKAKKSVALIKTQRTKTVGSGDPFFDMFFRNFGGRQPQKSEALGSGFVIDEREGYLITNNHVIEKADSIEVTIDGKKFKAKTVGSDPQTDIGLIKIEGFANGDIKALKLADSDKIKVGSFAIAIGNPFGLSHSVTLGIVSATGRSGMQVSDYEDFIQTDAAINPGNSGGPLLNIDGEVIGVNTAILSRSGGYMGIGLAVPSNMAKEIVSQLKSGKGIQRAMMGVVIMDLHDELRKNLELADDVKGVFIAGVEPGSPADKAGIQRYDVITSFNGKPTENSSQLRTTVGFSPYNKKLPVELIRDGKKINVSVVLTKDFLLKNEGGAKMQGDPADNLGFSLSEKGGKVVVESVEPGSLAQSAGFRKDDVILDVNRKRVKSLKEAMRIIASSKKLLFRVARGGRDDIIIVINK